MKSHDFVRIETNWANAVLISAYVDDSEVVPIRTSAEVQLRNPQDSTSFCHIGTATMSFEEVPGADSKPIDVISFRSWGAADTLLTMIHPDHLGSPCRLKPEPLPADAYSHAVVRAVAFCGGPVIGAGEELYAFASDALVIAFEYTRNGESGFFAYATGALAADVIAANRVLSIEQFKQSATGPIAARLRPRDPAARLYGNGQELIPTCKRVKVKREDIVRVVFIFNESLALDGHLIYGNSCFYFSGCSADGKSFTPVRRFSHPAGARALQAVMRPLSIAQGRSLESYVPEMIERAVDKERKFYPATIKIPGFSYLVLLSFKRFLDMQPQADARDVIRYVFQDDADFLDCFGECPELHPDSGM